MTLFEQLYSRWFGPTSPLVIAEIQRMIRQRRRGRIRASNKLENKLQRRYGLFISCQAEIGEDLSLPHPVSIVIGAGCKIGNRVCIYQNVTLGAASRTERGKDRYPQVGDDTIIYAGAVLLGGVRIGSGCTVGANSVVLQDIPDGATAVGSPARIV